MQSNNKMFEDAAKLAGGALGAFSGVRREVEALVHQQMERLLAKMDLVTRDEFEAVKAMAVAAREENEKLAARLDELDSSASAAAPKD
jgi:BMFP domain-containing protein YqiC